MLITEGCQKICAKGPSASSVDENDTEDERTPITSYSNSYLEIFQKFLDLKREILTPSAFQVLLRKKNELALQLRQIEDEIAMNDKLIKWFTALSKLDVKDKQPVSPSIKRKSLFEAVLDTNTTQSSCQKLEDICRANNWTPPTYNLTQRDGGFIADLAVRVLEYEFLGASVLSSSPDEARESAAAGMLTNLRNVAKNLKQTNAGQREDADPVTKQTQPQEGEGSNEVGQTTKHSGPIRKERKKRNAGPPIWTRDFICG